MNRRRGQFRTLRSALKKTKSLEEPDLKMGNVKLGDVNVPEDPRERPTMTDPKSATQERAREQMKEKAKKDGIEFFMAMGTEVNGKPNASVAPAQYIDDLLDNGAAFAGFASGGLWQEPSDGDIAYIPDPTTYTRLPWRPDMAVLMKIGRASWRRR